MTINLCEWNVDSMSLIHGALVISVAVTGLFVFALFCMTVKHFAFRLFKLVPLRDPAFDKLCSRGV